MTLHQSWLFTFLRCNENMTQVAFIFTPFSARCYCMMCIIACRCVNTFPFVSVNSPVSWLISREWDGGGWCGLMGQTRLWLRKPGVWNLTNGVIVVQNVNDVKFGTYSMQATWSTEDNKIYIKTNHDIFFPKLNQIPTVAHANKTTSVTWQKLPDVVIIVIVCRLYSITCKKLNVVSVKLYVKSIKCVKWHTKWPWKWGAFHTASHEIKLLLKQQSKNEKTHSNN